jgi:hypothetical protein
MYGHTKSLQEQKICAASEKKLKTTVVESLAVGI